MKKLVLSILVGILAIAMIGCSSTNKDSDNDTTNSSKMQLVEVSDLKDSMQIIDTREESSYIGWKNEAGNSGHIKNAIDFPVSWLKYETNSKNIDIELERRHIDKEKETVIYGDNTLSEEIFNQYSKLGIKNLKVLNGGINEYAKTNSDLERLPGYKMYVSPQWVQDLIDEKEVEEAPKGDYKIVEIDFKDEEYESGHIKDAVHLLTDDFNHIPGPREVAEYENIPIEEQRKFWGLIDDNSIKEQLENIGIDKDTTVIIYADYKATTGANRAALVMDYMGVEDIRLLNGGKEIWKLEGRELVKDVPNIEKVDFGADVPLNPDIIFDYEETLEMVDDSSSVLASVRSWEEYLGKKSGYTYISEAGDIKNARFAYAGSDPYAMEDYRNIDNTLFNYKIIEDRWNRWGITSDKLVSFYCGTGWRASETYYAAKAMGWEDIGVYVGGWYEWTKYPNSPVMEKGLPKDAPEKEPEQYFYKHIYQ